MALPSSGVMKASMIQAELGESGSWSINSQSSRVLAKVPSGTIKFSDFYGKSNGRQWVVKITMGYKKVTHNRRHMIIWGSGYCGAIGSQQCYAGDSAPLIDGNLYVGMWSDEFHLTGTTKCFGIRCFQGGKFGTCVYISGDPKKLNLHIAERNLSVDLYKPDGDDAWNGYRTDDSATIDKLDSICRSTNSVFTVTITEIKYYLISALSSLFNILREVI